MKRNGLKLFKGFTKDPNTKRSLITHCLSYKQSELLWLLLKEEDLVLDRKLLFKLQDFVQSEEDWKTLINLYLNAKIEPSPDFLFLNYKNKKELIKKSVEGNMVGIEQMLCLEYTIDLKMKNFLFDGNIEREKKFK
eukprot:gene8657-604_t